MCGAFVIKHQHFHACSQDGGGWWNGIRILGVAQSTGQVDPQVPWYFTAMSGIHGQCRTWISAQVNKVWNSVWMWPLQAAHAVTWRYRKDLYTTTKNWLLSPRLYSVTHAHQHDGLVSERGRSCPWNLRKRIILRQFWSNVAKRGMARARVNTTYIKKHIYHLPYINWHHYIDYTLLYKLSTHYLQHHGRKGYIGISFHGDLWLILSSFSATEVPLALFARVFTFFPSTVTLLFDCHHCYNGGWRPSSVCQVSSGHDTLGILCWW